MIKLLTIKISSLLFLFVLSSTIIAQKIKVVNCNNFLPLEDVIVFSENGKYLGITNENGFCFIEDYKRIRLSGLSVKDTLIEINSFFDFETVCTEDLKYNLEEFSYLEEKTDLKSELLELLLSSHLQMLKNDTVIYYNFKNTITISDSNWQETIDGVIKVMILPMSKKRVYARVSLCNVNNKVDDDFLSSALYNHPANNLSSFMIINTDFIFNTQKNLKNRFEEYVDAIYFKNDEGISVYEAHLKGAEININLKSKENVFFKDGKMFRQKYYSTNTDMTKTGMLKFYKDVQYTGGTSNFIKSMFYKSISKYNQVFFVNQFEISLATEECKDCIDKPINYKSYNLNYQNWLKAE